MAAAPEAAVGSSSIGATTARRPIARVLREAAAVGTLFVASVVIACGLGELVVRVVAPQQLIIKRPDVWEAVDTLGWKHRPNVATTINTGERTVQVRTDADGYRVGLAGRVAGARNVLLLGDSFMEAFQVEYEQSLAGLLESQLPAQLHTAISVRNTGVGGWDPPQYLMEARRALAAEKFDLVLVSVFLGNDVVPRRIERFAPGPPVDEPDHRFRMPRKLTWHELIDAVLYPVNDVLKARSHLFVFLKHRSSVLRMRAGLTADYVPVDLLRREADSPRWRVTAEICRDIRDVARQHGVATLFVLVPASYQVDTAAFRRALRGFHVDPSAVDVDQPERLLTAATSALGLDVIDVLPAFRRAQGAGVALYGSVDPHLSPAGHLELARVVEPPVAGRLSDAPARAGRRGGRKVTAEQSR